MGLGEVWGLFPEATAALHGADAVRASSGLVVAVDAAIWIVEATTQAKLRAHFDTRAAVVKVFFDRLARWVTVAGITPVVCLEGDKRGARVGRRVRRGPQFKRRCEDAKRVCVALGVAWVQAEGEAEALVAQLARRGLVHAVATRDSDVLAFGCSLDAASPPLPLPLPILTPGGGDGFVVDSSTAGRRSVGSSSVSSSSVCAASRASGGRVTGSGAGSGGGGGGGGGGVVGRRSALVFKELYIDAAVGRKVQRYATMIQGP